MGREEATKEVFVSYAWVFRRPKMRLGLWYVYGPMHLQGVQ